MYSEHKNAGKGRVMLGETFKELKATDPSFLKIDTCKDYKLFKSFCVCNFKLSPRIWIKSSLLLDVKTRYSIQ